MPTPMSGETKSKYVSRCIGVRQNENPKEDPKQSSAICYSMWDQHKKKEAKLEKISEFSSPMLATEHGIVQAEPQKVLPGKYPEFDEIELPENLKRNPWEWDDGKF